MIDKCKFFIIVLLGAIVFINPISYCARTSLYNFDNLASANDVFDKSASFESLTLKNVISNLPKAEEVLTMPLADHPRLLASNDIFAEIQKQTKTDETLKKWYEKLRKEAEVMLQKELPVYQLKDGKRLNSRIHTTVATFALLYRIENDKRYLNRAWQEIKATAEFADWNPAHFLDTARITYAFAIAYDWLYEDWNEQQRSIISSAIIEKGIEPALNAYQSGKKWTKRENNWNQVCNGGIGLGALAVMEEHPETSARVLYQALKRLPLAMQHYAPDGGWNEGVGYWHFGTFYNTSIIAALNTSLGNDFGLSKLPGFEETGFFPIYMNGAFNVPFNFSDGNDKFVRAPELFWMSERYGRPEYSYYQQKSDAHRAMSFIWYKPISKNFSLQKLPLDGYFRGTEVVTMRSEWENPLGVFVGFKAGDNKAPHSHLDLGTFIIDALGVRWATELGKDDYNLPGYFDREDRRWTYYRNRAEGQNTLLVNPSKSPDQNPKAESKIIRFVSQPQKAYAIADLTSAYSSDVSQVLRGIALLNQRKQILVQDRIRANNPVNLFWFMHTKANIQISRNGKTAMLSQDGKRLRAKILNADPNYRFTVMNAEPLPSSPKPDGQKKIPDLRKLTIKLEQVKNGQIAVLFDPLGTDNNSLSKTIKRWFFK